MLIMDLSLPNVGLSMDFNTGNKILIQLNYQSFHKSLHVKAKLNTALFNHLAWFYSSYLSSVLQKVEQITE